MKEWYTSRTVWGLFGAGMSSALMLLGVPEVTANEMSSVVLENLIPIIGLASTIFAYFGRKRATEPLKGPLE